MPKTIKRDDGVTVTATHTATMYGVPVYVCDPPMYMAGKVPVWPDGLCPTVWGRGILSEWLFGWVPFAAQSVVNATLWTLGLDTLDGWPFSNVREIESAP